MQKLLNCALNVALFPFQLDITQLLVDFNRFARAKIWQEYWFNREKEEEYTKPIFKSLKSNLPRNYCTPSGLKVMLASIRSEIRDPRNRNKETLNLPPEEITTLKDLIRLQKENVIITKAADKGAGIVILKYKD